MFDKGKIMIHKREKHPRDRFKNLVRAKPRKGVWRVVRGHTEEDKGRIGKGRKKQEED